MFTDRQKQMLMAAARNPKDRNTDWTQDNPALDRVIDALRIQASMQFLSEEEKEERVFFNKPAATIPYKGYITEKIPYFAIHSRKR